MYKITFTKTHICTKLLLKLLYKKTTNVQKQFFVQQTCFCTNILFRTNMFLYTQHLFGKHLLYKQHVVQNIFYAKTMYKFFFLSTRRLPSFFGGPNCLSYTYVLCAIASPSMFFSNLLLQKLSINAWREGSVPRDNQCAKQISNDIHSPNP